MDSFNNGFHALVIGGRGGIGAAVADVLAQNPACGRLETVSRGDGDTPFDITDDASVAALASRLAETLDEVDLIFIATGALTIAERGPEKSLKELTAEGLAAAFAVNAIGPALLIKHLSPLLPRRRRSVLVALSARVGSIGDNRLGGWTSYRASKAGLNQILRCAAVELNRTRPMAVCAALHPGTVATPLTAPYAGSRPVVTPEVAAERLLRVIDALPQTASGGFFAYDGAEIPW